MIDTIKVTNLKKHYPVGDKTVKAVDGLSFNLQERSTLGIVGESGCGKSTLAKCLMGLESLSGGSITIAGKDFSQMSSKELYHNIQMVFQNPLESLNPRKKAWEIIADPLLINEKVTKKEAFKRACDLMETVGLRREHAHKYPHMFSGGQRQRIGIARALILKPKVLILDEPVSALDVSVQAQVLNLLRDLQKEFNLTYIFISHDLSVVRYIADKVLVMYLGKVCEYGKSDVIFETPHHPYTKTLLKSAHAVENEVIKAFPPLKDVELPSPLDPPSGCNFHTRCPLAVESCKSEIPECRDIDQRSVFCHEVIAN
ncbi:ABC transporter ATP-binding protein [Halobacteriovorax sp. DPLXC-1]|uniref:ABC transporter ATP-binding protein n=1 Tax=Halobacteriovorax sp. DPLXC-1 TaxID=3110771 RepID=UPI002FF148CB